MHKYLFASPLSSLRVYFQRKNCWNYGKSVFNFLRNYDAVFLLEASQLTYFITSLGLFQYACISGGHFQLLSTLYVFSSGSVLSPFGLLLDAAVCLSPACEPRRSTRRPPWGLASGAALGMHAQVSNSSEPSHFVGQAWSMLDFKIFSFS